MASVYSRDVGARHPGVVIARTAAGLPVLILLLAFDVLTMLLCLLIVGVVVIDSTPEFPVSWAFVRRWWLAEAGRA